MDGLKKCPFCGGEAKVMELYYAGSHPNDIFGYEVECQSCGVSGVDWDTAKEAVDAWNERR